MITPHLLPLLPILPCPSKKVAVSIFDRELDIANRDRQSRRIVKNYIRKVGGNYPCPGPGCGRPISVQADYCLRCSIASNKEK